MKIFIDGEAGTTGLELHARLGEEKNITLLHLPEAQRKDTNARADMLNQADIAALCLPPDAAREAVSLVENRTTRILDASTAFRTDKAWVWGMAEWDKTQPAKIASAGRVSNPGCYALGAVALLRPLTASGILSPETSVTLHAISGYSGGGKQLIAAYEGDAPPSAEAYALDLQHKHSEEIRLHGGLATPPLFSPLVGNFYRGMLVMLPLFTSMLKNHAAVEKALAQWYEGSEAIIYQGAPPARLDAAALAGSDQLEIFAARRGEQILLLSRLDNLGKGAAGAALQNIRLMMQQG